MMTIEEKCMRNTSTGGPAFARPASPAHEYGFHKHQEGMTLRDYFAAKAMAQLVHNRTPWGAAEEAYQYADAMLKARDA
jgi:hypothetical protein